jgi:UDP-glucose 4-epimerase
MKIVVTGGAGYIGSHTCIELTDARHQIVIFDNFSNSNIGVSGASNSSPGRHLRSSEETLEIAILSQLP